MRLETHRTRSHESAEEPQARNGQPRKPPAEEAVAAFQALMARQASGADSGSGAAALPGQGLDEGELEQGLTARAVNAEWAALLVAQRLSPDPATRAETLSAAPQATLADLIEKHVRQLLVSRPEPGAVATGQMRLTLSDDLLPDTELWLSQEAGGWHLRAETGNAESHASLKANAQSLVERFADTRLGYIEVETRMRGD